MWRSWLARLLWEQEVPSSSLGTPTIQDILKIQRRLLAYSALLLAGSWRGGQDNFLSILYRPPAKFFLKGIENCFILLVELIG